MTVKTVFDPVITILLPASLCVCVCCFHTGMRQMNDRGTQYRSAIYTSNSTQLELAVKSKVVYQQVHSPYSTSHQTCLDQVLTLVLSDGITPIKQRSEGSQCVLSGLITDSGFKDDWGTRGLIYDHASKQSVPAMNNNLLPKLMSPDPTERGVPLMFPYSFCFISSVSYKSDNIGRKKTTYKWVENAQTAKNQLPV